MLCEKEHGKSVIEFLPLATSATHSGVFKYYLNGLHKIIDNLHLSHLFVYADEKIYSRVAQIM